MRGVCILLSLLWLGLCAAEAQTRPVPVTPAHPSEFGKRRLGATLENSGVSVGVSPRPRPAEPRKTVRLQYIGLTPPRVWTSVKGSSIVASLVAFEEGRPEDIEDPLTVVRDGKVRLLKQERTRPYLLALDGLSEEDRRFVRQLQERVRVGRAEGAADPAGERRNDAAKESSGR